MYFPHIETPSGGPLTAADLDAARKHSTGRTFPAGLDQQGRHQTRSFGRAPWHDTVPTDFGDSCALECAEHHEPAPTRSFGGPRLGLVLVLVTGVPFVAALIGAAYRLYTAT